MNPSFAGKKGQRPPDAPLLFTCGNCGNRVTTPKRQGDKIYCPYCGKELKGQTK